MNQLSADNWSPLYQLNFQFDVSVVPLIRAKTGNYTTVSKTGNIINEWMDWCEMRFWSHSDRCLKKSSPFRDKEPHKRIQEILSIVWKKSPYSEDKTYAKWWLAESKHTLPFAEVSTAAEGALFFLGRGRPPEDFDTFTALIVAENFSIRK